MTTAGILGAENSLIIFRGSSKTLSLEVKNAEGEPVDLTGARIVFTVKCRISDVDNEIQKDSDNGASEIEFTDATQGHADIKLGPSDTAIDAGTYIFDVWVVLVSGEKHLVVGPSELVLKPGVTVLC